MNLVTPTTIQLSWISSGPVVEIYMVSWMKDVSAKCSNNHRDTTTITDGSTSYIITELEEDSTYNITVTASIAAASAISTLVTGKTMKAGNGLLGDVVINKVMQWRIQGGVHGCRRPPLFWLATFNINRYILS